MSLRSLTLYALALVILPALPASLAAQFVRPHGEDRPQVPQHLLDKEVVSLTLEQVIEMALRNNLDISVARYSAQQSANDVVDQQGVFDVNLFATGFYQDGEEPVVSGLVGVQGPAETSQTEVYSLGFEQQLDYGANWRATTNASRLETNDTNQLLNPSSRADVTLEYNQPLLKNLGRDAGAYQLRVTRSTADISREGFRNQVNLTVEEVVKAYWDLVYAIEDLAVKEQSLALAEDLLRQNIIMVNVGTLAPIEITVAKAEVASRKEAIITAEANLEDAEDNLLFKVNMPPNSPAWDASLYPLDLPPFEKVDIPVDMAYETALQNRPEVAQKLSELNISRLGIDYNRDQLKPQLDLAFTWKVEGLGGDLNPDSPFLQQPDTQSLVFDADAASGGLSAGDLSASLAFDSNRFMAQSPSGPTDEEILDAYDEVINGNTQTWSIGLNFRFPIQNRSAKARLANARLDYEQKLAEAELLEDQIRVEVRTAIRTMNANLARVEAARETVLLRQEQLRAERKKFEEGLTTNYQVLQFQRDLEDAQTTETSTVVEYAKSIVALKRITGELLPGLGIQLDAPKPTVGRKSR